MLEVRGESRYEIHPGEWGENEINKEIFLDCQIAPSAHLVKFKMRPSYHVECFTLRCIKLLGCGQWGRLWLR